MRIDRPTFFTGYKRAFQEHLNQSQVDGLEFLLDAFERDGAWKSIQEVAYALATVKHEDANTYHPIVERGPRHYFDKYEHRTTLGNAHDGDGFRYRGRGYTQITGRKNYRKFGIENDPDEALDPQIAFDIMTVGMHQGSFTGKKLSNFINEEDCDYHNARTIINGHDDAALIAGYARKFERILADSISAVSSFDLPDTPSPPTTSNDTPPPVESVETSVSAALPPIQDGSQQIAENITNVATGAKSLPDNFVSEDKTVVAPEASGILNKGWKWLVGLGLIPTTGGATIETLKNLAADGQFNFVDAVRAGREIFLFILPYLFWVGLAFIIFWGIKELLKQVSFLMQVWLTASADKHNITIESAPKPERGFLRLR